MLETPAADRGERFPAPNPARVPIALHCIGVERRAGRVLDRVGLILRPGTVVGIRGRSGSGKSTLLDLLLGLRSPDDGRITVGGVDLADIDPDAWRRRVAWVPQNPVPGASRDAARDVDLALHPGTRIALTGPSGSGKSTVVAALLRTLAPTAGRVLADGRDARELTGDDLRAGIAWCGAWTHLFDSTLRANLQLAAPAAGDADLVAALRRARLGDWFDALPDGLDTLVGEHGGAVSGGERQRLGVARALLADRPVLLFDEPTAHLDPATAEALAAELLTATAGRTTLIVTHRPEHVPHLPEVRLGRVRTFGPAGPVCVGASSTPGRSEKRQRDDNQRNDDRSRTT